MRRAIHIFLGFLLFPQLVWAQIAINEFNSKRGFVDENGNDVDWIEVFNHSSDSVLLSEFYLSDNPNNLDKWQFPNIQLASQSLITICASGKENVRVPHHWESLVKAENTWKYWTGPVPPSNYNDWNSTSYNDQLWSTGQGGFGYGDGDDNTVLSASSSVLLRKEFQIVDAQDITHLLFHADYDDAFIAYLNGVEIMRSSNFASASPSYNELATTNHEAVLYSGGTPDHVLIESADIQQWIQTGANTLAVRVHNVSSSSSDMSSNFFLTAGVESTNEHYQSLPSWITPPLVVPHADFKLSSGETICISDTGENIVDSVQIPESLTNTISRGRTPDGVGSWCYFNAPSPNASNATNTCFTEILEPPIANVESGWHQGPLQLTFTTAPNTRTFYTTNGDVPDDNDSELNGPLVVYSTTVISLRSYSSNNQILPSPTVDLSLFIDDNNHNLPVISIITDEDNLWDWNTGIYVSGPNAANNWPYFGSNFWEPWSKKSRMEYFDGSRRKQFDAEFDLEIHGGWSRAYPQKSFRIDAKSIYTGSIDYVLFDQKPALGEFNNFNLRNGGQHCNSDRIQDATISRLAKTTSIDRVAYQPCIVYLNGTYWGLYGIREKVDEHYLESNHGVDPDELDLLNRAGALVGSVDHFNQTAATILSTGANDPNFMSVFNSYFDINNYLDYFIFQTYIQNEDWLGISWGLNNVKIWRPDTVGGKWRYVMYDTDAAFGHFGGNVNQNYLSRARNPSSSNEHASIFDHALDNPQFKCHFANRYDDLINTTFQSDNFNAVSNELKESIEDAVPDHINNWRGVMGPYSSGQWSTSIGIDQQYNASRISPARQHLNTTLGLYGERQIRLDAVPSQSGEVQLNSIVPELPWDGIYHGGCPVTAKATPNWGFMFTHWYSNNSNYNNLTSDSLQVSLSSNTNLFAHFDSCQNVVSTSIQLTEKRLVPTISQELSGVSYRWEYNGNTVSNDTVLYNPIDGDYRLTIRFDSCEVASEVFTVTNGDYTLHTFPNPAVDEVQLQFVLGQQEDVSIRIYNSIGKLVKELNYSSFIGQYNNSIDVSQLNREMHFIRVLTPTKDYAGKLILID